MPRGSIIFREISNFCIVSRAGREQASGHHSELRTFGLAVVGHAPRFRRATGVRLGR
jgi:hypothetical protein